MCLFGISVLNYKLEAMPVTLSLESVASLKEEAETDTDQPVSTQHCQRPCVWRGWREEESNANFHFFFHPNILPTHHTGFCLHIR